jgi:hypothetical protein
MGYVLSESNVAGGKSRTKWRCIPGKNVELNGAFSSTPRLIPGGNVLFFLPGLWSFGLCLDWQCQGLFSQQDLGMFHSGRDNSDWIQQMVPVSLSLHRVLSGTLDPRCRFCSRRNHLQGPRGEHVTHFAAYIMASFSPGSIVARCIVTILLMGGLIISSWSYLRCHSYGCVSNYRGNRGFHGVVFPAGETIWVSLPPIVTWTKPHYL